MSKTLEIDRMVQEGEEHAEEDRKNREKVEARNSCENYAYSLRNSINNEELAGALSEEDKQTLLDKISDCVTWIEDNQTAEKDEYEYQQKELENVANPIMAKLYAAAGVNAAAGAMPGGFPGGAGGGFPGGAGGGFPGGAGMPGMPDMSGMFPGGMPGMPGMPEGMPGMPDMSGFTGTSTSTSNTSSGPNIEEVD